ncbi:MAG: hypothetical protein AAF066_00950 [Pseudomonadota bacterium]
MKKKSAKRQKPKKTNQSENVQANAVPASKDRRNFMSRVAWIGAGVVVAGGATVFGTRSVLAKMAELDLERIGQGVPAVVQIHDPSCSICTSLQRQARKAMKGFEDQELIYLVADISTTDGRAFAARYGVPHVTIMMFNERGRHEGTMQGMRQAEELKAAFQGLLE